MNTAKAMAVQQRRMLASASGMTAIMQSAAASASGMLRALESFDTKAAARAQQGMESVEKAMTELVEPIKQATRQLQAMSAAIPTMGGNPAGSITIVNTVQAANTVMAASQATAVANSEKKPSDSKDNATKLGEKIEEFGKILAKHLPTFQSKDGAKKDGDNSAQEKAGDAANLSVTVEKLLTAQESLNSPLLQIATESGMINATLDTLGKLLIAALGQIYQEAQKITTSLDQLGQFFKSMANQRGAGANGGAGARPSPVSSATTNLMSGNQQALKAGKRAARTQDMEKQAAKALPAGPSVPALPGSVETGIVLAGETAMVAGGAAFGGGAGGAAVNAGSPSTALAVGAAETALVVAGEAGAGGAGVSAEAVAQTEAASAKAAEVEAKLPNLSEQMVELSGMYKSFISENEAVSNFINDNWSFFGSVYEGASVAIQAYNALQLISKTYTFLNSLALYAQAVASAYAEKGWRGLNAAMKGNIIILIVTLIAGLVMALVTLYKENDAVAMGFLKAWHSIILFFYRIPIYFWSFAEAAIKAFLFLYEKASSIFDFLFDGLVEGIKSLFKLFGKEIELDFKLNTGNLSELALAAVKAEKAAAEQTLENKDKELTQYRENLMTERAAKRAADEIEQEQKVTGLPTESSASNSVLAEQNAVAVSGGRLDEVGKINDTVDISSEDIKMMRELAEMKNIQNFVTLQPSVNVQTGDIRNGMDVGSMVQAITTMLQDEISSSAEGVYR
ncbi:hypothetical protein A7K91_01845 [Paenibacillus oryzae]|uniref:Uncharacterized protein n=1 Tax=Paenibacillus oryzae TaxID=1844972 RepID=A0A1A5YAH6_9BACL|nr:hypothetical protein [Paenibacillus oryzae]OBR62385.1 hypothetical protein A7K91_01845 [Paenibacillus oryzae]